MLHECLEHYLAEVGQAIEGLTGAYVERYQEEIVTPERINLKIRVRFVSGQLLEVNEAVMVENVRPIHLDYRYHCQDAKNRLLFRYDSTPHFPGLSNFPHHKHTPDSVTGVEKPPLVELIREIENILLHEYT